MTKVETITFEYEECGECPSAFSLDTGHRCGKTKGKRVIPNLCSIPDWCPLPDKEK